MYRVSRFVGILCLAGTAATVGLSALGPHRASAAVRCGQSPLAGANPTSVAAGAWVVDLRSGCEWGWNRADRQFAEASVSKVALMGMALQKVAGGEWDLGDVDATIQAMITQSDNDATTRLWNMLGGRPAVMAFHAELGMDQTSVGWGFGTTTSSARDVARMTAAVIGPDSILPADLRDYARNQMLSVIAEQAFGATAGAPAGWAVAVKNGWWQNRPQDRGYVGHWRVNSTGLAFDTFGQPRWIITVMGDNWSTFEDGVQQIEQLSQSAHANLAARSAKPKLLAAPRR
jgi:beta-lactamase class A